MSTIYEVNFTNTSLQVAKDMIFGWTVRTNEEGCDFVPVSSLPAEKLKFLQGLSWPIYIPNEFRAMIAHRLATLALTSNVVEAAKPAPVQSVPLNSVIGEPRSVVVDSWLKIYQLLLEKLVVAGNGFYKADLGYCTALRCPNGTWRVENIDRPEKSKDFENIQEAVFHIARVWW